ncbi:hypothetical protein L596_014226 [Steinernema carpocapsae]|uniref:Uncharacterized protein n=1 Tax=Steinernema carpocapsae TaxID=34508 RepID=A0A4U5NB65_STECR|nr:hypothetical protein L596_014226 [Steinernema carpocapsae]
MSVDVIWITFRTKVDDVFSDTCWDFDSVVVSQDAVGVRSPDAVQFFAHSLLARVTGLFAYVRPTAMRCVSLFKPHLL